MFKWFWCWRKRECNAAYFAAKLWVQVNGRVKDVAGNGYVKDVFGNGYVKF